MPYLDRLGVTDCYSSPLLKAAPGSTHGYDICDHSRLDPALGSEEEFASWADAMRSHGLGHVLDLVPNHMSCDPMANLWWRDVLENGPSSPYAKYFDIDWDPVKPELKGKVLLPLLGDQYGRVIERGELQLSFEDGALHLRYFDRDLPVNPRQTPRVLSLDLDRLKETLPDGAALREFLSILTALQNLPAYTERDPDRIVERQREKEVARERLARLAAESAPVRDHIDAVVRTVNGVAGDGASFDYLHDLLERQAYRLAYWRTAVDEINYRRFFDINELVGVRMEESEVFDAANGLVRRLTATGPITGFRVDHPDGLFDPAEYFERLQRLAGEAVAEAGGEQAPFYVVAEKILAPGESLRSDWAVAGTTGYQFLNLVSGLFIDGRHAKRLRRIYTRVTGHQETFDQVAYTSKRTIMLTAMASELNVLAHALNKISERDRRHRDFTLNSCRVVLREVIANFPVYRTYISQRGVDEFDRGALTTAIGHARRRNPLMEASIFEFLEEVLLTPFDAESADDPAARERLQFAMKMQQFTSPVMAKGTEDTAFYRYHVLVSANDVGAHPAHLGVTPAEFHEANLERRQTWSAEMITTATHDTKRGEDARMRGHVVSEMPEPWRQAVSEWMRINARHRMKISGVQSPDRNDEYLFYQALVGMWPAEPADAPVPERAPAEVVPRVIAYMQKAAREAKVHTSWINEDQAYGLAITKFVERALEGPTAARFLRSFVPLQRRIARIGMLNALAQLVLKLASPGVTDFYQGNELWDLSLVDPDNRRDVDYARRGQLLDAMMPVLTTIENGGQADDTVRDLLTQWDDGQIKMFITAAGLRFRRQHRELMLDGSYVPLAVDGPTADHIVVFARHHASGTLVAAVPRLTASLTTDARPLPLGEDAWTSTRILLPEGLPAAGYRHVITGEAIAAVPGPGQHAIPAAEIFRTSPVALLWSPSAGE